MGISREERRCTNLGAQIWNDIIICKGTIISYYKSPHTTIGFSFPKLSTRAPNHESVVLYDFDRFLEISEKLRGRESMFKMFSSVFL